MPTSGSLSSSFKSEADEASFLAEATRRLSEPLDEPSRRRLLERCVETVPLNDLALQLKEESSQNLNIDAQASLRQGQAIVDLARLAGHPGVRALGQMAVGDAYRALARYQESVAILDEAGNAYLALDDEVGWARTRTNWVWASHCLGRGATALNVAARAHDILTQHSQWLRAAALDLHTAWVCAELGRYDQALALYDRAQQAYELSRPADEVRAAFVKQNMAWILTLQGRFKEALQLHQATKDVFVRNGVGISALKADQNMANVYVFQGRYTQALHVYIPTKASLERAGLDTDAAWIAHGMVECYLHLNRYEEARQVAEEAIDRFDRCGSPTEAAKSRYYHARACTFMGDIDLALGSLDFAARALEAAGMNNELGIIELQRANLMCQTHRYDAVALHAYRARMIFSALGHAFRVGQADLVMAQAALALSDHPTAIRYAHSALAIAQAHEVDWLGHEAHHVLGVIARDQGNLDVALDRFRSAIDSVERIQSALAVELRGNFLADKLQVFADAIEVSLRLSRPRLALAFLEAAKARALVDYLANNVEIQITAESRTASGLVTELARLREEHNWFYNRLYGLGIANSADSRTDHTGEVERLRSSVRLREKQIAGILERLALDRTEGLDVVSTHIAEDEADWLHLEEDTVLLEYFVRDNAAAVFVVTSKGLDVVPLPVRPSDIRRLQRQWHVNLASAAHALITGTSLEGLSRNASGILGALYAALVAPVIRFLTARERLIVVPYGPLHSLPFHAFHDGHRNLLEFLEVSYCPSSTLLKLTSKRSRRTRRSALVVANSDGGRLPSVIDEVHAIAACMPCETFLEAAATRDSVVDNAPRHSVLHLAAHGEARLDNPTFAHVKLADGQLSSIDVFNLDLHGALVTLSACETGRGVAGDSDEIVGLARGFLHAGASTLVQSLWRVEDGSTAALMQTFYQAISDGHTKGTALRRAQLALLETRGEHPYCWAPFQLVGDSGMLGVA